MLNGYQSLGEKKAYVFRNSSSLPDDSRALNSLLLSHSNSYTSQRSLPPQSLLDLILEECAWSSSEWMVDQRSALLLCNINVSHQVLKNHSCSEMSIQRCWIWEHADEALVNCVYGSVRLLIQIQNYQYPMCVLAILLWTDLISTNPQ